MIKQINAMIILPVAPVAGKLAANSIDSIFVVRDYGYYDVKHNAFTGYFPYTMDKKLAEEYPSMQTFLKEERHSLSDIIEQGKKMGMETIIVATYPSKILLKLSQSPMKAQEVIKTVDALHSAMIKRLNKYFRVVEINGYKLYKNIKAQMTGEKENKLKSLIIEGNIDGLYEEIRDMHYLDGINLSEYEAVIHPYYIVNLAYKSLQIVNPYKEFYSSVMKYIITLTVVGVLTIGFLPPIIRPFVANMVPSLDNIQIRQIETPTLDKIKGMYLPPLHSDKGGR